MSVVTDSLIDLVITSPPYNVGRQYTKHNDNLTLEGYLAMLDRVWKECERVMKPGARIAVNVPHGTGRQPYLPIGSCVTLQLEKRFELLGTIVWRKTSATLRTSWGSWRRPDNPYLRDVCELIIIAKTSGNLDIPQDFLVRDKNKVVSPWLSAKEFVNYTRDYWEFETSTPSQSYGHPASFPVELPRRLIKLFAYSGATVLDPFAGSGTVGIAAKQLGCSAILCDLDQEYCSLMATRLSQGGLFDA